MKGRRKRLRLRITYLGGAILLLGFGGIVLGVPPMFVWETFGEVWGGTPAGLFADVWMIVGMKLIMRSSDAERFGKYLEGLQNKIERSRWESSGGR